MRATSDTVFVAGHRGLVGSAVVRRLEALGYSDVIVADHATLDLTDQAAVRDFFRTRRPAQVYLAAAKVGGIVANDTQPADFILDNMLIEANVVAAAHEHQVARLLFLGSACVYPKVTPQPIREDALLTGTLEPTNEPYAVAKIAGIKLCESFHRQHGSDFRSVMPTNLYGPGDNYHPEHSHVLPALLRRFHEAARDGAKTVTVWGTGRPRREFLHVDDMAAASVHVLELDPETYWGEVDPRLSHVNVGWGRDLSIAELADAVARVTGFTGSIDFDSSRPDGTMERRLDVSRLARLGWTPSIDLEEGLRGTYADFLDHLDTMREA